MNAFHQLWSWAPLAALGWTLLHSLWQGAAVAVALAAILRANRNRVPQVRYIASCCAMLLTLCIVAATFVHLDRGVAMNAPENQGVPSAVSIGNTPLPSAPPISRPNVAPAPRLLQMIPLVGLAWGAGVMVLGLAQFVGWTIVIRLRNSAVPISQKAVMAVFNELALQLRVQSIVQLGQSGLIQVPTVIGWLRPIVLLPASALTGLTCEQLRGLIAHELAHVRRCDYLVNLIQTSIETLFFHHPAIWWIGGQIRQERELCCDDIAAAACSRGAYVRALERMEHLRQTPSPAMSAGGGALLPRIRRLLKPETKSTSPRWSWVAPALLLVAIAFSMTTHAGGAQAATPATRPAEKLYYISGVPRSGAYELGDGPRSIQQAMVAAGFTEDPAGKLLILVRRDASGAETRRTFDLDQIEKDPSRPVGIQDDDVLLIESKPSPTLTGVYYLGGSDVPRTGVYSTMGRKLSLLQALVAAGVDPAAQRSDWVLVVRNHTDSFRYDMTRLLEGSDAPYIIQPNDTIMLFNSNSAAATHAQRLVVGKDEMTLEGQPVTPGNLRLALDSVPDPANTALEFAVASKDVPKDRRYEIMDAALDIVGQLHMKYITDIGVRPIGSRASDP